MRDRESIGYVVAVEGSRVTLNLKDAHKGQVASHRSGISSVTEINSFCGVNAGARMLILRVTSLSFLEPREIHRSFTPQVQTASLPLRQIVAVVVGWISRNTHERLAFAADSLSTPSLGAEAFPLSSAELSAIVNPETDGSATFFLGTDCRSDLPLKTKIESFLGRHVAVLGSTGQGKTCFSAAIIQQLVKLPAPRIVIFDINGEFELAFKTLVDNEFRPAFNELPLEKIRVTNVGGGERTYRIPYYALGRHGLSRLLLPSEKTQRPALAFALEHLQHVKWFPDQQGAGLVGDSGPVLFDDCRLGNATSAWNAIQKLRDRREIRNAQSWPHMASLAALVAESHSLKQGRQAGTYERDIFHYSNVAPLVTRIKRFIDDPLFTSVVDVDGGSPSARGSLDWQREGAHLVDELFGSQTTTWKLHILNLKHVAHDLMPFILGSLLELFAFELFRRGQGNTYPTLLVLEEAHHYLRQISEDDGSRDSLAYERLAKEGRKYGVGLWISTQRPSEVSDTVLAQCGTWVVFRLTSENDQRAVGNAAEWVDRSEVSRISGLPRQQALVFGSSVPVPARIVAPTACPLPDSQDPDFSLWYDTNNEEAEV